MPLSAMPFDIYLDKKYLTDKSVQTIRAINTTTSVDKRLARQRTETAYAYHPRNSSKYGPGETVDFVIA